MSDGLWELHVTPEEAQAMVDAHEKNLQGPPFTLMGRPVVFTDRESPLKFLSICQGKAKPTRQGRKGK
jgi:hypothetical protein